MSEQVKSGQLRATPSYLGTLVAPLNYGDRLQVLTGVSLKKQFPTSFNSFLSKK